MQNNYEFGCLLALKEAQLLPTERNKLPFPVADRTLSKALTKAWKEYGKAKDPSHGQEHIKAVTEIARDLAKKYNVNQDMATAAAVLHDIGREKERRLEQKGHKADHAALGAKMVKKYIASQPKEIQQAITHAVREHRASTGKPRTLLAKLIADADKLPDIVDTETAIKRLVEYRRSRGMPQKEIYEDSRKYMKQWLEKMRSQAHLPETRERVEAAYQYYKPLLRDPALWKNLVDQYKT